MNHLQDLCLGPRLVCCPNAFLFVCLEENGHKFYILLEVSYFVDSAFICFVCFLIFCQDKTWVMHFVVCPHCIPSGGMDVGLRASLLVMTVVVTWLRRYLLGFSTAELLLCSL